MSVHGRDEEHIGEYELLEPVEQGVAGKLYRARHMQSGQAVLVKVVARTVGENPAFQRYFYDRWVQQPSLVEHPNVLQVLRVGQEEGLYYAVVEDSGGQKLAEKLKAAPLAIDEAMAILRQTAEGLRAAHRRDIVHGHLKPSDIVLATDKLGRPLVKVAFLDLGTGATGGVASIFGEITGTPKYMAPEVIRGREPDAQADIFALGVLAYELVTGKEPFPSEHALGYLFANCQQEAVPADKAAPGVPREVALIINRMLGKGVTSRYRTMQRVIDDMDRCAESIETGRVEVVPPGTDSAFARGYELAEAKRRRPLPLKTIAVVGAVLVVGAAVFAAVSFMMRPQGGPLGRAGGLGQPTPVPQAPVAPPPRPLLPPEEGAAAAAPRAAPTVAPGERREDAARRAFEKAQADWERYKQSGAYELGVTAFSAVADEFADTPSAQRAAEEMGRIYAEWAQAGLSERDYADAVAKYGKALEVAPQGSRYAELARRELPLAIVKQAEDAERRGRYGDALELYEKAAAQFPGTLQASLKEARKPRLLLGVASVAWKEQKKYEDALATLLELVRDYPGSEEAKRAAKAMPDLYLDSAAQKLQEGKLADARQQLQQLAEAYPGQEAGDRAAELDAEIAFRLLQAAISAGKTDEAGGHFGALLQRHAASPWTVQAARVYLGLEPERGATPYDANTTQDQMKKAQELYGAFDFVAAVGKLNGIIRYAPADSPTAGAALSLLPAWRYEAALWAYGKGLRQDCEKQLAGLAAQFPVSAWAQKASGALEHIQRPPSGMAYVPEGRFYMGTDMAEIESLMRTCGLLKAGGTPAEATGLADIYGLVNETPKHIVSTPAFYVDKTEVTNEQYKQFVDATGSSPPPHWQKGAYPEGQGKLPVVNVTVQDAAAYARWAGKRLPTETEWEKAGRGIDGRVFPWGETFNDKYCQHMKPEAAGPVAVGTFPSWGSPYGCLDVIGNVQEWTSSTFAPYEGTSVQSVPDPKAAQIVRGGAWYQQEIVAIPTRCASRYWLEPAMANSATGFRCVQDIAEPALAAPTAAAP
jgi:iron(II)-dependent oxidoreductase